MEIKQIKISTEYIKLDQLLKFSGVSSTGSEAKAMILDGQVTVNGEICLMRGKKLREGDFAEIAAENIRLEVKV